MIRLFDIENGKIKPTEHCYTIKVLKAIMKKYPKDHIFIYAYLFYKSCLNKDLNPFRNVPEDEKQDLILEQVGGEFSVDDPLIAEAEEVCIKLYQTPTYNAYLDIKVALENIGKYMRTTSITDGRDGNVLAIGRITENYKKIRESFKATEDDLDKEQATQSRGNQEIAYDQL